MIEITPVDISDYYNLCIRYALRRIGSKLRVSEFLRLPREEFHQDEIYRPGTILVWNLQNESENIPHYIMENGTIITSKICKNIHVGVLEKSQAHYDVLIKDIFSELTYISTNRRIPCIQCRRLSLLSTLPNSIIREETIAKREKEIYGE